MNSRLVALPFGIAFGFLLAWGRLADPDVILAMLLLREPDLVFVMGSATMVAAVGAHVLRAAGARSLLGGEAITWSRTRPARHHLFGSALFGAGWSVACTCPGPIAAQVGSGHFAALFTVAGVLTGVGLRAWVQERAAASKPRPAPIVAAGL